MLPSALKYLYSVEPVRMHFAAKQPCTNDMVCYAALHTVSFVHGCFAGKCILTGSTEYRYFKADDSMEKKWDTAIPADLKRLFVSGTYVSLVTKRVKWQKWIFKTQLWTWNWHAAGLQNRLSEIGLTENCQNTGSLHTCTPPPPKKNPTEALS